MAVITLTVPESPILLHECGTLPYKPSCGEYGGQEVAFLLGESGLK